MKNVDHWLPPNINCAYQVFHIDEYAETVHNDHAFQALPQSLQGASRARKASFRAGRACATQALTAGAALHTSIEHGSNGLPYWPVGWAGSISHALVGQIGIAIAVVVRKQHAFAIAVDCEPIFESTHASEISPLIASVTELRLGERLGYSHTVWLTMVYSLKETLYKLLYAHVRCFMPFEAAELLSFDTQTGQACLMLSRDWGDLTVGQRYWLQTRTVRVEEIGECVLSFGLEQAETDISSN